MPTLFFHKADAPILCKAVRNWWHHNLPSRINSWNLCCIMYTPKEKCKLVSILYSDGTPTIDYTYILLYSVYYDLYDIVFLQVITMLVDFLSWHGCQCSTDGTIVQCVSELILFDTLDMTMQGCNLWTLGCEVSNCTNLKLDLTPTL